VLARSPWALTMEVCTLLHRRVSAFALLIATTAHASLWATSRNVMPAVVGHRGIPAIFPENTMISFRAALEAGADGIESDLHLTADKVLVLLHDDTLNRTTVSTLTLWMLTGNMSDPIDPTACRTAPVMLVITPWHNCLPVMQITTCNNTVLCPSPHLKRQSCL
jgi:hypothetical protein